ncbi:MAG: hypothetical protein FWF63_00655 [Fibromonadales bacterium]|nr:hypothetical protein [Fibromonadales bacterium]
MKYAPRPYRYKTEEERIAAIKASKKRYTEKNRDILKEYNRDYQREKYRKEKAKKNLKVKTYQRKERDE